MAKRSAMAAMVAVAAWGAGVGCDGSEPEPSAWEPLVAFDTIAAALVSVGDTVRITAELADTGERRSYGLMERDSLPAEHGMLFVYPETREPAGGFWMYRTRIPLDIAFLDEAGTIVAILGMQPCTSPNPELCRRYSPGVPYRGALEMAEGWFAGRGVEVGDRVVPAPGEVRALP